MSKNILKSKTFWFNVAASAVTLSGVLPSKQGAIVGAAGNIALRFLTTQPVRIGRK